jgi:hypothetical protein
MRGGRRLAAEPSASGAFEILPGRRLAPAAVRIDLDVPVQRVDSSQDAESVSFDLLPNLMDPAAPGAGITRRQLVAGEVLWQALALSPHNWRRSITLDGELMSFYCPPARVALEIVEADGWSAEAYGPSRSDAGVRLVPIPISDVEQRCTTIVGWLDTLCASRIIGHAQVRSAGWLSRKKGPDDQPAVNGASAA